MTTVIDEAASHHGEAQKQSISPDDAAEIGQAALTVLNKLGQPEITPEVESFVADVDSGEASRSDYRLEDRLRARSGFAKDEQGNSVRPDGRNNLKESRTVTPEQRELVKVAAAERSATAEKARTASVKLKSLEATRSFFDDIVSGEASRSDYRLEDRLRARSGFAKDEQGNSVRPDGRNNLKESRTVTPEQRDVLQEFAERRARVVGAAQETGSEVRGIVDTASFFDDIVSGEASRSDYRLEDRLRARSGFAKDEQGNSVRPDGRNNLKESRTVTPEQRELVATTVSSIRELKADLPQDLKTQLGAGLDGSKLKELEEQVIKERGQAQVPADVERCDAELETLAKLVELSDQIRLVQQFAAAVQQGPDQARGVLGAAEVSSTEDSKLVGGILTRSVVAARLKLATESVLSGQGSPEEALNQLQIIAESPFFAEQILAVAAYAKQRQIIEEVTSVVSGATLDSLDYETRMKALMDLPERPTIEGFDYFKEKRRLVGECREILVEARTAELRRSFGDKAVGADALIEQIMALPSTEPEDIKLQEELLEALAVYLFARRKDRPADFGRVFDELTERVNKQLMPELPKSLELGRNLGAAKSLARKFKTIIAPIFQAARGDERTKGVEKYITGREGSGVGRESYTLEVERLAAQRELTDLEREYLESVEALSIFNPHLVAIARECPEVAEVVLKDYFERLSSQTTETIEDGSYVPLLFIGLGPEGVTALGELLRINPALASTLLAVDQGAMPGGPFAVPEGPAWLLNSASARGNPEPMLPDSPLTTEAATGVPEERTVRALSGPLGFYPGERPKGSDTRPGSINTTVNYLPTPDDISDEQFALNDDLALIVQLQAAMLLDRAVMRTRVVSVEPNRDPSAQGDKLVTLMMFGVDGTEQEVKIRTDAVINASGLGEPSYGFQATERFAELVDASRERPANQFPLVSTTLEAFQALAGKEGEVRILGDTIVISGSGNSTATLVEYIGGIVGNSDNPTIRNVRKIYVVAEGDLSRRSRYKAIAELRSRGGRGNLVEFISSRVGDAALDHETGRVILYDQQGNPIKDSDGEVVEASSFIAGTGFIPTTDRVFSAFLSPTKRIREGGGVKSVVLPTNPDIAVADVLEADPTVLFVGTASRPQFQGDKLDQLPTDARRALVDNGAGNAVAIGFRAPDTRAAIRLFLDANPQIDADSSVQESAPEPIEVVSLRSPNGAPAPISIEAELPPVGELPAVRRDLSTDSTILTPLFLGSFGRLRLAGGETAEVEFDVQERDGKLSVAFQGEPGSSVSSELLGKVAGAVLDRFFVAYWLKARSTRRERDGLRVSVAFRNGRLDLKETYVEPI